MPIGKIEFLLPEERHQLLIKWNETDHSLPETTLPELFQMQAEENPNSLTLVFKGDVLSYAELNERANLLAHLLIERGAGPERFVALALPRSAEMVISMLAVLKAGAAYLPIDPEYPADRIDYMLGDAQPMLVITSKEAAARISDHANVARMVIDEQDTITEICHYSSDNPVDADHNGKRSPLQPAYMIYTSGSTGET